MFLRTRFHRKLSILYCIGDLYRALIALVSETQTHCLYFRLVNQGCDIGVISLWPLVCRIHEDDAPLATLLVCVFTVLVIPVS